MIETINLSKTYRRFKKEEGLAGSFKSLFKREYVQKKAVKNISLHIAPGEFVGVMGPNGAGKTTLIKMLTGIISPTAGKIQVAGHVPEKLERKFKHKFAVVMGQKSQLFLELTANDTLRLLKEIYGISEERFRRNREELVELLGTGDLMDVQVRTLSLGERMKVELIAALIHQPDILFLDEPTIGLDVVAARQMREFLKRINKRNKTTILLTSHYTEDIKSLCERSVVISQGSKIFDGETEELFNGEEEAAVVLERIYLESR